MDIEDQLKILSTMSLRSCSHDSLRNYFKNGAEEIQALRVKVASAELLVEALRELQQFNDVELLESSIYVDNVITEALATYDKLSEVKS